MTTCWPSNWLTRADETDEWVDEMDEEGERETKFLVVGFFADPDLYPLAIILDAIRILNLVAAIFGSSND